MISMVSMLFDQILKRVFGYLVFLCFEELSWIFVFICLNLFSVSINEIIYLCLLDSFFQGNLSFSSGLSFLSNYFGGELLGLVMIVWMLGVCFCLFCVFLASALLVWGWRFFSLDLVQHGTWLSGWSSFLLVLLLEFSVCLFDLSSCSGSFLHFELSSLWICLHLHMTR